MTATEIMLDTIGGSAGDIPKRAPKVAGYLTGGPGVRWTPADWERFNGTKIPIHQAASVEAWLDQPVLVVDVEAGAATVAIAIAIARLRADHGLHTTIYIAASNVNGARSAVDEAGLAAWVTYWVASWGLTIGEAGALLRGPIVAFQIAAPQDNPHGYTVPGTRRTLTEANVDLSVTLQSWAPAPARKRRKLPRPRIHRKVAGSTAGAAIAAGIIALLKAAGVHADGAELAAATTLATLVAGYLTPAGKPG